MLVAATVATSVIVPTAAGAVTTIAIGGAVPTASAGRVQVTIAPAWVQVQPVPVALTNVVPAGRVSVTVRLVAAAGPLFATVTV